MSASPFHKGDRIGNYEIVKPLRCGNYGCVYKAKNLETDSPFALKVLKAKPSPKQLRALRREASVQSELKHKNIVRCFDFQCANASPPFLVLDYVEGSSLQDILYGKTRTELSFEKAYSVIKGCLEALIYAHSHGVAGKGVVHGDVKPGNILIPSKAGEEVKLADFGVARILGTYSMRIKGSSKTASPELQRSWKEERKWDGDYQCDLFSLGVVAYILVVGRHPFGDYDGEGLTPSDRILDEQCQASCATRLDGKPMPVGFDVFVAKLLQKDRFVRFQSGREALNCLSQTSPQDLQDPKGTQLLAHPQKNLRVAINFDPKPIQEVDLDVDRCVYELKEEGRLIKRGKMALATGAGGWQCILPLDIWNAAENVTMVFQLRDKIGNKWITNPFFPFVSTQKAIAVPKEDMS